MTATRKLLYLDLCCFNRPFDDQSQTRIRLETEAKLVLQDHVRSGACALLWSAILDWECRRNPYRERREAIEPWRALATGVVMSDASILARAGQLELQGIKTFDALHLASAERGGADLFVTTDDRLRRRAGAAAALPAVLPQAALAMVEGWYEN